MVPLLLFYFLSYKLQVDKSIHANFGTQVGDPQSKRAYITNWIYNCLFTSIWFYSERNGENLSKLVVKILG